jgi:hypothetical protein
LKLFISSPHFQAFDSIAFPNTTTKKGRRCWGKVGRWLPANKPSPPPRHYNITVERHFVVNWNKSVVKSNGGEELVCEDYRSNEKRRKADASPFAQHHRRWLISESRKENELRPTAKTIVQ